MKLSQLLLEALNLMFIGMLFVGLFLGILVFLVPLLNKMVPDDKTETVPASVTSHLTNTSPNDETLIAVISAAVQQYRNQHK